MQFEPIIKSKLKAFQAAYELENVSDGIAFERFANQTILTAHQPNAFTVESDLMDLVSVGGHDDMGIDGLAIKLNGVFIRTNDDVSDLLSKSKNASVEFIFIQSKFKDKFDSGEFSKFINGVTDFLGNDHFQPCNEKIKHWVELKDYILGDEIMVHWEHNPEIRLYYVVMGQWNDSPHIIAISNKFSKDVESMNTYGEINIHYVDSLAFKNISDNNENMFTSVLNIIDIFSLTEVEDVDNSSIILCSANEFMKLLTTDEGMIRKTLFNDNVRDYQGDTTINNEIFNTIASDPYSFVLLNNGITIVCDSVTPGNRKITIKNPQIVNGCQTSSVLYHAQEKGVDLTNISLSIKVIATKSDKIMNKIVRGTNKQNIVYDEAFEVTRDFHKDLEDFFNAMPINGSQQKIYYERRSKQYTDNPMVKPLQKINFRILIQNFISTFLYLPHLGYRHEFKLLQDFQNKIFIDTQSKYPYYVSSLLHSRLEKFFKSGVIGREYYTYKSHLMMITKDLLGGKSPNINNEKLIDAYCENIVSRINDDSELESTVKKAVSTFDRIREKWVAEKGDAYRFGIKDSPIFTSFLLENIESLDRHIDEALFRGRVVSVKVDKNGLRYGFISRVPKDIFFHSGNNPDIDFNSILDKDVEYNVLVDTITKQERAIDVRAII